MRFKRNIPSIIFAAIFTLLMLYGVVQVMMLGYSAFEADGLQWVYLIIAVIAVVLFFIGAFLLREKATLRGIQAETSLAIIIEGIVVVALTGLAFYTCMSTSIENGIWVSACVLMVYGICRVLGGRLCGLFGIIFAVAMYYFVFDSGIVLVDSNELLGVLTFLVPFFVFLIISKYVIVQFAKNSAIVVVALIVMSAVFGTAIVLNPISAVLCLGCVISLIFTRIRSIDTFVTRGYMMALIVFVLSGLCAVGMTFLMGKELTELVPFTYSAGFEQAAADGTFMTYVMDISGSMFEKVLYHAFDYGIYTSALLLFAAMSGYFVIRRKLSEIPPLQLSMIVLVTSFVMGSEPSYHMYYLTYMLPVFAAYGIYNMLLPEFLGSYEDEDESEGVAASMFKKKKKNEKNNLEEEVIRDVELTPDSDATDAAGDTAGEQPQSAPAPVLHPVHAVSNPSVDGEDSHFQEWHVSEEFVREEKVRKERQAEREKRYQEARAKAGQNNPADNEQPQQEAPLRESGDDFRFARSSSSAPAQTAAAPVTATAAAPAPTPAPSVSSVTSHAAEPEYQSQSVDNPGRVVYVQEEAGGYVSPKAPDVDETLTPLPESARPENTVLKAESVQEDSEMSKSLDINAQHEGREMELHASHRNESDSIVMSGYQNDTSSYGPDAILAEYEKKIGNSSMSPQSFAPMGLKYNVPIESFGDIPGGLPINLPTEISLDDNGDEYIESSESGATVASFAAPTDPVDFPEPAPVHIPHIQTSPAVEKPAMVSPEPEQPAQEQPVEDQYNMISPAPEQPVEETVSHAQSFEQPSLQQPFIQEPTFREPTIQEDTLEFSAQPFEDNTIEFGAQSFEEESTLDFTAQPQDDNTIEFGAQSFEEESTLDFSAQPQDDNIIQFTDQAPASESTIEFAEQAPLESTIEFAEQAPIESTIEFAEQAPLESTIEFAEQAPLESTIEFAEQAPVENTIEFAEQAPVENTIEFTEQTPVDEFSDISIESTMDLSPQPAVEPAAEPAAVSFMEMPVAEPAPEPAVESFMEMPAAEPAPEPAVESFMEMPTTEPALAPTVESFMEMPATEPAPAPAVESFMEMPATESAPAPAPESTVNTADILSAINETEIPQVEIPDVPRAAAFGATNAPVPDMRPGGDDEQLNSFLDRLDMSDSIRRLNESAREDMADVIEQEKDQNEDEVVLHNQDYNFGNDSEYGQVPTISDLEDKWRMEQELNQTPADAIPDVVTLEAEDEPSDYMTMEEIPAAKPDLMSADILEEIHAEIPPKAPSITPFEPEIIRRMRPEPIDDTEDDDVLTNVTTSEGRRNDGFQGMSFKDFAREQEEEPVHVTNHVDESPVYSFTRKDENIRSTTEERSLGIPKPGSKPISSYVDSYAASNERAGKPVAASLDRYERRKMQEHAPIHTEEVVSHSPGGSRSYHKIIIK